MNMKNFFNKMKTYSFWVSFSGALIILVNALGRAFGFKVENQIIEDCIMSIAGILVVLGIVTMGDKKTTSDDDNEENVLDKNEQENSHFAEEDDKNNKQEDDVIDVRNEEKDNDSKAVKDDENEMNK